MNRIDLNADLGEGMGQDEALLALVSSCNIACGGHAGDAMTMRATLLAARDAGVAAGAHPSYPDKAKFGRKTMEIAPVILGAELMSQVGALVDIGREEGVTLTHVKPHGALYHAAEQDEELARLVAEVTGRRGAQLKLVGPPGSALEAAAASAGVDFVAEGFADRAYRGDGRLVPRSEAGAVIEAPEASAAQALAIAQGEAFTAADGRALNVRAQTICLHGDTPGAVARAQAIRAALEAAGIEVAAP